MKRLTVLKYVNINQYVKIQVTDYLTKVTWINWTFQHQQQRMDDKQVNTNRNLCMELVWQCRGELNIIIYFTLVCGKEKFAGHYI